MGNLTGLLIGIGPVLGVLAWCNLRDRWAQRASAVRARINAIVNHALGGESLVSVHVAPRTPWRLGQVMLSAPTDSDFLIVRVAGPVIHALPADYELVARPARGRA